MDLTERGLEVSSESVGTLQLGKQVSFTPEFFLIVNTDHFFILGKFSRKQENFPVFWEIFPFFLLYS